MWSHRDRQFEEQPQHCQEATQTGTEYPIAHAAGDASQSEIHTTMKWMPTADDGRCDHPDCTAPFTNTRGPFRDTARRLHNSWTDGDHWA